MFALILALKSWGTVVFSSILVPKPSKTLVFFNGSLDLRFSIQLGWAGFNALALGSAHGSTIVQGQPTCVNSIYMHLQLELLDFDDLLPRGWGLLQKLCRMMKPHPRR